MATHKDEHLDFGSWISAFEGKGEWVSSGVVQIPPWNFQVLWVTGLILVGVLLNESPLNSTQFLRGLNNQNPVQCISRGQEYQIQKSWNLQGCPLVFFFFLQT